MFKTLPSFIFYDLQKFLNKEVNIILNTEPNPVFMKLLARRYIIQSLQHVLDCDRNFQSYVARNQFGPYKDNFRTDVYSHSMSRKIDTVRITFNNGKTEPKHISFTLL